VAVTLSYARRLPQEFSHNQFPFDLFPQQKVHFQDYVQVHTPIFVNSVIIHSWALTTLLTLLTLEGKTG